MWPKLMSLTSNASIYLSQHFYEICLYISFGFFSSSCMQFVSVSISLCLGFQMRATFSQHILFPLGIKVSPIDLQITM